MRFNALQRIVVWFRLRNETELYHVLVGEADCKNAVLINKTLIMKNRNLDHKDDWATPPEIYNELNTYFNK